MCYNIDDIEFFIYFLGREEKMSKSARIDIWSLIGIIVMIIGLLLAGSVDLPAEEAKTSSLNLGSIKEVGMDIPSRIMSLKEDREYCLNCLKIFREKKNNKAVEYIFERLKEIEKELKYLLDQKEILSSQKE